MRKQLLITFDYELFLGNRSGSVEECMLAPTRELVKIMGKHPLRSVFFVDTTYLLRLKEQSVTNAACLKDYNLISEQLCELIEKGHYVFPHIHPHWIDAIYNEDGHYWKLNETRKYRFHNISEAEREKIFIGSFNLLKSILHSRFPDYEVNAFRAGGWCIQPFTDFKPWFIKARVKFDFSVLGGFYQFTSAQYFDFSNAPSKNIYRFEDDVCVENDSGSFVQFNINTLKISPALQAINKLWLKFYYKLSKDHTFQRGEGQSAADLNGILPSLNSGKELTNSSWERIAVELMTMPKFSSYFHFFQNNSYMHFISHPKMINNHNLLQFDKFLEKVFDKYSVETDFQLMIH